MLLGVVVVGGLILGTLNVFLPDTLTIFASSTIGIFMSMQIFCVIGMFNNWFWTFQVSGRSVSPYVVAVFSPK